ncbi:MAG: TonB-dependent receptor [Acidobacteria bacterium]|nr:TonB-dependent receptor [Acidobacteriota bacterium]
MHRVTRLSSFLLLAIALTSLAFAQTTSGSIAGSIADQNNAAIRGASVKISDAGKSFSLSATTDNEGRFVFPTVPPGTYTLSIEAKGFKKSERTGLLLVANDKMTLGDITLEVGAASETVTVTAEATQVQSESAERSYAVQGEIVRNIAVNGRGFVNLASVATGVVFNNNVGNSDAITNVAANGLRTSANNLQLDGVAIVDTGNNGTMISVNLDAIAEFKVLTSNYQAEYGRSAGAQISAVTRSGTKDFHGSFYTFRRHDGMNANTWLNNRNSTPTNKITKPRLDQRDIGYTIGGPAYIPGVFNKDKDKFFFFFSQEHQKRLNTNTPRQVRVPTALERAGDFSQTTDNTGKLFPYIKDYTLNAPCNANDTSGCFKDGGVLGKIPANRLYPLGLKILSIYPTPNINIPGANYNYQTQDPDSAPQRQDLYRGDWNVNEKWHVTGKYLYNKNSPIFAYGSFVLGTNMPDFSAKFPNNRYSVSGSVTGSLSPTSVLEVTFGQSHNFIDILPNNPKFSRAGLGLTGIPVLFPGAVQLDMPPQFVFGGRVANAPNIGSNNAPFYNFNTTRDWSVSLSKIYRSHAFKFGGFWQNSFKPQSSFANNNGQYNFSDNASNPLDSQFAFANAALGIYNTFNQASAYVIGKYRYNNVEFFAQDNWKVSSKLTLDYGARFYWIQPQYDEDLQASNFLPDRFNAANASVLYRPVCVNNTNPCTGDSRRAVDPRLLVTGFIPTAANTLASVYIGRIVPNSGSITNGVVQAGAGLERGTYRNRGIQFAPRFGFGYDVTGRQSLVIRGGLGIFYDRPQGNTVFDLVRNPPVTLEPTFNFGLVSQLNQGQLLLAPPSLVAFDRQGKVPTTYAYNLGIQYKLPFSAVLDVSYVGTSAQHQLQRRNINAPAYGAGFLAANQDPTLTPALTNGQFNGASALAVDFLRPYQGFGNISFIEPSSSSNYHSLQTSVQRRYTKGLLLGLNYTWSKVLGTQTNDLPGINGFGAPHVLDQRRANYGPLDFDRTHNFNVNFVWDLPRATTNTGLGYALNGWQLSGIYRYVTGEPYNLSATINGLSGYGLTGTQQLEGHRIVLLKNPGSGNSSDPYKQFDVTAFASPNFGSFSYESGRNFVRFAPINSWDLALSKEFSIKEKVKFEVRLDAFNALNHTQFNGINTGAVFSGVNSATITNLANSTTNLTGFGAVNSVRPPRTMQLSGRINF